MENENKTDLQDEGNKAMDAKSFDEAAESQIDEKVKAEAEQYLNKRMNWTPRNEEEEDLFQMGLESLLENYI